MTTPSATPKDELAVDHPLPELDDTKDFVEHVRTVHFALVITCVALWLAILNNRESKIERAINQFHFVEEMIPDLSTKTILRESMNAAGVSFDPVYVRITLKRETNKLEYTFSHSPLLVSKYFSRLLDGKTVETLVDFAEKWNIARNDLHLFRTTSFDEAYWVPRNAVVRDLLDNFRSIPGVGRYESIQSEILDGGEETAFRFDTIYESEAGSDAHRKVGVLLNPLPGTQPLLLLVKAREESIFEKPFNVQDRILLSAPKYFHLRKGSFDETFPDLSEVTRYSQNSTFNNIRNLLSEERGRSVDKIEILGIHIPSRGLVIWGGLIVLCVQLYFNRHLRFLAKFHSRNIRVARAAWIALYDDFVSKAAVFATVFALPLTTLAALGRTEPNTLQSTGPILVASAVCATFSMIYIRTLWRKLSRTRPTI